MIKRKRGNDYKHWVDERKNQIKLQYRVKKRREKEDGTFEIREELWWMTGFRSQARKESEIESRSLSLRCGCSSDRKSGPSNRRTRCARSPSEPKIHSKWKEQNK